MKIRISSSISNFREKLLSRTRLQEYTFKNLFEETVFFGCYHPIDYLKFIFHFGNKKVVWCGGDITNLNKSIFWRKIIRWIPSSHLCENYGEYKLLKKCGIKARVRPLFFDKPENFPVSFTPSENPHVFITAHSGREEEYGLGILYRISQFLPKVTFHIYGSERPGNLQLEDYQENIVFHGRVPTEQFDEEIKSYQSCLRLNSFDGFGESLAKSALMGQYPISVILYPFISYAKNEEFIIKYLQELKDKKEPNYVASNYWHKKLKRLI